MVFKRLIAASVSVALLVTPTLAAAQSSAPAAQAATEVAPAGEQVAEGSALRGGFVIPLIALIAIILGLCAAGNMCGGDDDDLPNTP